MIKMQTFLVL